MVEPSNTDPLILTDLPLTRVNESAAVFESLYASSFMNIGKAVGNLMIGTKSSFYFSIKRKTHTNVTVDGLKLATSLTFVGGECYNLICDLYSPDDPELKSFYQIVALVKTHSEPKSAPVPTHHPPAPPPALAVDDSSYDLGVVPLRRDADGSGRPVHCAPRPQHRRAHLRAALAIVFGVIKHHRYLYGRHCILRSYHKPLI
ncbi:hypothetical protein EVAR_103335_1 [Eumeta japonica]|uniref:Reverse transcriptase RNase H-like domain-containing protein n=1 Tax=Eumeta variegata TaxID=151549 RepID=A0A4C1Z8M3_EUMVA|nr:hypothetical protein EVAR_103335_1 [Eumeta japonica]